MQNKAVTYEKRGWCSTYIQTNAYDFYHRQAITVEGYFTLSNKVLKLSDSVSNHQRRKLFAGLKKQDTHSHFILIGQLGKYLNQTENRLISGNTSARLLLDDAFGIIYQVKNRITCNCVLVECKDSPKLCSIYESYGFQRLQASPDSIKYFKTL